MGKVDSRYLLCNVNNVKPHSFYFQEREKKKWRERKEKMEREKKRKKEKKKKEKKISFELPTTCAFIAHSCL